MTCSRSIMRGKLGRKNIFIALERRLAEAELNIQALARTQFDAILESGQTTPLLLRQAQLALQRSNELLEQRVAERTAALAESEMKYRALFENNLDLVFLTRTDGTIVDANPAACQALDMTREEICARGRAGIIKSDMQLAEGLQRRAATSRAQVELTFIRKDGSTFLAEVDFVIVNPEWKDWTTFVTARDITDAGRPKKPCVKARNCVGWPWKGPSLAPGQQTCLPAVPTGTHAHARSLVCPLTNPSRSIEASRSFIRKTASAPNGPLRMPFRLIWMARMRLKNGSSTRMVLSIG